MNIRSLHSSDIPWVESVVTDHFGSPKVVSRGVLHDALSLPGLVAEQDSKPVGLLQFRMDGDKCEVVVLISTVPRQGIGRKLLESVESVAEDAGCSKLWLITTNNNTAAIEFYRRIGWTQVAIHRGAMRAARKLKPEIPEFDEDGNPIEDEIEFKWQLPPATKTAAKEG